MSNENQCRRWRVFIVDPHPTVRKQLTMHLQQKMDLEVCGTAVDGRTALASIHQRRPDLVLLDISSKRSYGLDFLKQLKTLYPQLRVLVLSLHTDRLLAERALQAGAAGCLNKQEATVNIFPAIEHVLRSQDCQPANAMKQGFGND